MQLRQIARLDEWYRFEPGTLFITGLQALVRLLLAQSHRDRIAGLNTAGFVSGYRGSPLGGLDRELWRAQKSLDAGRDPLPAGAERGPRGDLDLGRAADQSVLGRALRRRVLDVVREGARRRPLRRRVQARQRRRHVRARRRARRRGRRPHVQVVVAAASERVRLRRRNDSRSQSRRRERDRRARPIRLRAVALQRLLDRAQGDAGDGRRDAVVRAAAARSQDRRCRRSTCRRAASTSAGPIRRTIKSSVCSATSCAPRSRSRARTG